MIPLPVTTTDIVSAVFFGILIFFILAGNSLVIGSFRVNRRLRTKTNYFIMSLAFADLAIGLMAVPSWIYISLKKGRFPPDFYAFWLVLDVVVGVSSILNLTMISLERGYALMRPMQHRNISKITIILAIVTAWALALFAGCLQLIISPKVRQRVYGIVVSVVFFFVPLAIILVTYGIIFKIASAHARGRGVRSFKKDLRIATTVAVVIGFFSIAWLPFFSLNLFFTVCRNHSIALCLSVPPEIVPIVKLMQYGNSACNPVIYGFRNKDFKIAFKKIIYKMCGKDVAVSSYSRSTYVTRNTKRFVRSESSFDESQSVIYTDQIIPPGMYDMRDSYRSAVTRGRKKPAKPKPQRKGLALGLMALNTETFSLSTDVNANTSQSATTSDVNGSTADTIESEDAGVESSTDIEVYPLTDTKVSRDQGVDNTKVIRDQGVDNTKVSRDQGVDNTKVSRDQGVDNKAFVKSHDDITKAEKSTRFHVHFGDANGVVNGGLVSDDNESSPTLLIPVEKERSNSDVAPRSIKGNGKTAGQRSLSFT
ncbi:hypothetical protein QZH41_012487 [Actinostola sp. cb2023]|nr:hypothetical protein QZH41_012487 [Actinostola sp. cb2023]